VILFYDFDYHYSRKNFLLLPYLRSLFLFSFSLLMLLSSPKDCVHIVTLLEENHNQQYVANCFGVSPSIINQIFLFPVSTDWLMTETAGSESSSYNKTVAKTEHPICYTELFCTRTCNHRSC